MARRTTPGMRPWVDGRGDTWSRGPFGVGSPRIIRSKRDGANREIDVRERASRGRRYF